MSLLRWNVRFSTEVGAYCRDHDNSFDFCLKDLQIEPEAGI